MSANGSHTKEELRTLLLGTTTTRKHSAYQSLPTRLAGFIGPHDAQIKPKYERERFEYIVSKDPLAGKNCPRYR